MLKFLPENFLARRKFFLFKKFLPSKLSPYLIIFLFLIFAGFIQIILSPKPTKLSSQKSQSLQEKTNTNLPTLLVEEDKEIKDSTTKGEVKRELENAPQNGLEQKSADSANNILGTTSETQNQNTQLPPSSSTPNPSPPAPAPTPPPSLTTAIVSVTIITPNPTSNFTVLLEDGFNVCDVLIKAKNEGKISSLTLDDSYLSTYKSLYVYEINGFANNWTFTVNGESPLGCSLYFPKDKDTIVWKFG